MRNLRSFLILASCFILYSSNSTHQEWSLKIFFDVKGGWNFYKCGKGNYELKILFEGWLFRDNGDYGISFLKDLREDKTYYWKVEIEERGKKIDFSENIKPDFEGGISIRNGAENLVLLRISSRALYDYPLAFPSTKGFGIIEKNDDYDRYVVLGSNKLSFKDEDLKKEFFKKTEWEWKKTTDNYFSYHKAKAFIIIKPGF